MPSTLIMMFLSLINKNYFVSKTDYHPLRRDAFKNCFIYFKIINIYLLIQFDSPSEIDKLCLLHRICGFCMYVIVLCVSCSVVYDSLQPHGLQPPRLLHTRSFPARILEWLPFPSPGDLPDLGVKPGSSALQADSLLSEPPGKPSQE